MEPKLTFFDSTFPTNEQLLRQFMVRFESINSVDGTQTKVFVNGIQAGDIMDDNAREDDGYRFHDVFHYTFAAMLGWSPCTRALLKRKRKSDSAIDKYEDGARATITEEAISLLIFNKAKQNRYFENTTKISSTLLRQIQEMISPFEVRKKSVKEWETAILTGYMLFRKLMQYNGGRIHYDMPSHTAVFESA